MRLVARRVLVVANPAAGLLRSRDAGADVARAIRSDVRSVSLARTSGPGDATRLAAAAASERYDLVLAVGGDGTAHEVAHGLVGSETALGVAPAGTMNLLARVLGLPLDAVAAARLVVRAGHRRSVRPARAGERPFLLMAGIGFDAWVLRGLLSSGRKIRFRDYTVGALRSLTSYPFPRIEIEADGVLVSGHSAIVGRSSLYGGFLRPTPRADLDRDELEVCILSGGAGSLARLLPAMWSAGHVGREGVTHRVVTRVTARADHPGVPVQLDGELAGQLPATFVLDDRTLQIAY